MFCKQSLSKRESCGECFIKAVPFPVCQQRNLERVISLPVEDKNLYGRKALNLPKCLCGYNIGSDDAERETVDSLRKREAFVAFRSLQYKFIKKFES